MRETEVKVRGERGLGERDRERREKGGCEVRTIKERENEGDTER